MILDKYGREASALFSNVDFEGSRKKYVDLLLTKYSKTFDCNKKLVFIFISTFKETLINEMKIESLKKSEQEKEQKFEQQISFLKNKIDELERVNSYVKTINRNIFNSLNYKEQINAFENLSSEVQQSLWWM